MDGITFGTVMAAGICCGMTLYYTVDSIAGHWRRVKVAEFAAALKQQMVDKGFSADEIVRVLAADAEAKASDPAGTDLTTALVEHGYDAGDVADITAAVDDCPAELRGGIRSAVRAMVESGYEGDSIQKFVARRVEAVNVPIS